MAAAALRKAVIGLGYIEVILNGHCSLQHAATSRKIFMSADIDQGDERTVKALSDTQALAFWSEFSRQLPELQSLDGQGFVSAANELLHQYAPGLAIELEGAAKEAGSKLVISAHGNTAEFENAQIMVRHAPGLQNFRVEAYRSRTLGADFGMRMEDFELTSSDVLVGYYDAGGITGLELAFAKPVPMDMQSHAQHMTFIMLDHVLGEWDFSVRVGPVEFVEAISPGMGGPVKLSEFPPVFDAFVRQKLGRSYEYPQEQDSRWLSLEVRSRDADEEAPADILSFHDSANAVATRADMSYFVEWRFPFDSQQQLDQARDAQDALDAELARHQRGILVFTRVENMSSRMAAYYADDPVHAQQLASRLAAEHAAGIAGELTVSFDPAWNEYLSLYGAIHRRGDEQ